MRASVSTKPHFSLATRADDADIRRLLREIPMRGQISLSLEREPDYFADADLPGEEKQTIVARESGRVVCVGSCAIRKRFVNGQSCRVGYLGSLRLDWSVSGRFDIVRRGYRFFRELQAVAPADFYFTSIAADNDRARNFLERGLPGMPRYEFIGEFVTVLLPKGRRSPTRRVPDSHTIRAGSETGAPRLADVVHQHNRLYQFAPCWSADELRSLERLGLHAEDLHAIELADGTAACAALWDQRRFKQTVIRGYAPWLAVTRPVFNLASRVLGNPRLPAVGETLSNAIVSHLAIPTNHPETLLTLIAALRATGKRRGIELLTLGFAANDPRLAAVRVNFLCREYRSRVYVVRWAGTGGPASELDARCLAPEVALL